MSVTSQEMRGFALECLRWSDEADDAGQREIMIGLATTWINAANKIDQHVANGGEVYSDLRIKLN